MDRDRTVQTRPESSAALRGSGRLAQEDFTYAVNRSVVCSKLRRELDGGTVRDRTHLDEGICANFKQGDKMSQRN